MKLSVEEWNKLPEEEKAQRKDEMPDELATPPVVKEDVVIIEGKSRPLKNYESELRRKHEEELENLRLQHEQELRQTQVQKAQEQQNQWLNQVYEMAENEIATTGKTVPIQTIMQLANTIAQRNLETNLTTREQSDKAIRNFKRSVHSEPDWKDLEDDFDELVDKLKPNQVNPATLEIILNSVRGKKLPDIVKKIREETKKTSEKETEIIGSPTDIKTGGSPPKTSLSSEQKIELDRLNSENNLEWTEEEYKSTLLKKQNRFKNAGAKNTPQILSDVMIK